MVSMSYDSRSPTVIRRASAVLLALVGLGLFALGILLVAYKKIDKAFGEHLNEKNEEIKKGLCEGGNDFSVLKSIKELTADFKVVWDKELTEVRNGLIGLTYCRPDEDFYYECKRYESKRDVSDLFFQLVGPLNYKTHLDLTPLQSRVFTECFLNLTDVVISRPGTDLAGEPRGRCDLDAGDQNFGTIYNKQKRDDDLAAGDTYVYALDRYQKFCVEDPKDQGCEDCLKFILLGIFSIVVAIATFIFSYYTLMGLDTKVARKSKKGEWETASVEGLVVSDVDT